MDTLESMKVFTRVAQRLGFAAAARDLRMSPGAVTKHVAALEARVAARLLDRTTRQVSLTEAGRVYLERCLECLQALEDADTSVSHLSKDLRGMLRVTAPTDFPLSPIVGLFMSAFPNVMVDLRLSNRPMDLVEEGIDVAVRVAPSLDGQYVARPLAVSRVLVFAAPAYLRRHGQPRRPEDLAKHRSLVFVEPRPRDEWTLERGGKQVRVKLDAMMVSNSGAALLAAAVEGVGLMLGPSFMVRADVDSGKLVPLMLDWTILPELRVYAAYPHRRFLAPKVRAFVETLRAAYGDGTKDPWLPSDLEQRARTAGTIASSSRRPSRSSPARA